MAVNEKDKIKTELKVDTKLAQRQIGQLQDSFGEFFAEIAKASGDFGKKNKVLSTSIGKIVRQVNDASKMGQKMGTSFDAGNNKAIQSYGRLQKKFAAVQGAMSNFKKLQRTDVGAEGAEGRKKAIEESAKAVSNELKEYKRAQEDFSKVSKKGVDHKSLHKVAESFTEKLGDLADNTGHAGGVSGLGSKAKGLSEMLTSLGSVSTKFEMLGSIVGGVSKVLTGFWGGLLMLVVAMDGMAAKFNKRMLTGVGAHRVGDRDELLGTVVAKNAAGLANTAAGLAGQIGKVGDGFRYTQEALEGMVSTMYQAGVAAKDMDGSITTAATVAGDFGMSLEEGAGMVAEYYKAYGKGTQAMTDTFSELYQQMGKSNMTSTNFLSVMQSVTAQMDKFLDSTKGFSKVLATIGSSGAYSQKQIEELMNTIGDVGVKTFDEGYQRMALYGGAMKKQAKEELKNIDATDMTGMSTAQREEMMRKRQAAEQIMKGGALGGGQYLHLGLSALQQTQGMLGAEGITNQHQLKNTMNSPQQMEVLAKKFNVPVEKLQVLMMGLRHATDEKGNISIANNEEAASDAMKAEEAHQAALKLQNMTMGKLEGSGELTNVLLFGILSAIKKLLKFFHIIDQDDKKDAKEMREGLVNFESDYKTASKGGGLGSTAGPLDKASEEDAREMLKKQGYLPEGIDYQIGLMKKNQDGIGDRALKVQFPGDSLNKNYVGDKSSVAGVSATTGAPLPSALPPGSPFPSAIEIRFKGDAGKYLEAQQIKEYNKH